MTTLLTILPVIKDTLFKHLKGIDLIKFCQTSSIYAKICSDDRVWEHCLLVEFPIEAQMKPDGVSWRRYYLATINYRVGVYYQDNIREVPWIRLGEHFDTRLYKDHSLLVALTLCEKRIVAVGPINIIKDGYFDTILVFEKNDIFHDPTITPETHRDIDEFNISSLRKFGFTNLDPKVLGQEGKDIIGQFFNAHYKLIKQGYYTIT